MSGQSNKKRRTQPRNVAHGQSKNDNTVDSISSNDALKQRAVLAEARFTAGPIPSPDILAQYGKIDKDFPKIIMETFQKEQEHNHQMEKKYIGVVVRGQCSRLHSLF